MCSTDFIFWFIITRHMSNKHTKVHLVLPVRVFSHFRNWSLHSDTSTEVTVTMHSRASGEPSSVSKWNTAFYFSFINYHIFPKVILFFYKSLRLYSKLFSVMYVDMHMNPCGHVINCVCLYLIYIYICKVSIAKQNL